MPFLAKSTALRTGLAASKGIVTSPSVKWLTGLAALASTLECWLFPPPRATIREVTGVQLPR